MASLDIHFKHQPKRYIAQVFLAAAALFIILWIEHIVAGALVARAVLVGAIASSAFILFISPHRPSAMPRRVLGGHGWAILLASLLTLPLGIYCGTEWGDIQPVLFALHVSVVVGLAMLAMAATNTEHAPAAGTALAIAGNGFDWHLVLFVVLSVLALCLIHRLLRHHLIDLY